MLDRIFSPTGTLILSFSLSGASATFAFHNDIQGMIKKIKKKKKENMREKMSWRCMFSKSKQKYYWYNSITRKSQWAVPEAAVALNLPGCRLKE